MAYTALQLANAFLQTGELTDARQTIADYLSKDVSADLDYEAVLRLWIDLLAHGDEADQRLALSEYDRLPHFSATDYIKRAMLHYRLGELSSSRGILEIGLATTPDDERLCESLLFIYKKIGDSQAGLSLIKTLPKKWVWSRWAGDFSLMNADGYMAIAHYSEAIQLLEMRYSLSDATPAQILSDPAMNDAEKLTIMGVYADILLARAEAYHLAGKVEDAKRDEARAKRLIPNDPTL